MDAHVDTGGERRKMNEQSKRVLVVDDQESQRERLARFLVEKGHRAIPARSCVEAISSVIAQRIDVIILKAQLPGLSGYDTAPLLKKIAPDVKVILITNEDDSFENVENKQIDFFECLVEPVNLDGLERRMQ